MILRRLPTLILFAITMVCPSVQAEEGMWPFNMVPVETMKKRHGVSLDQAWLDHVRSASLRFNNGGSGSFVSRDGLVMTNHHVGSTCIQQLSSVEGAPDLMANGFVAAAPKEELRCPDLELNALISIEDVTARVEGAAKTKTTGPAQNKAKKAEMAKIEKACTTKTGLRCNVVTLYSGGAYHLYRYKKYTDVRLVFAPEIAVAFFGGDQDNFTYPRFCLDVALFRAYENDRPVQPSNHLKFSAEGAADGAPVFLSGNPGSTDRFVPVSKLLFTRDVRYPYLLERLKFAREQLLAFSAEGEAQKKAARDTLFSIDNGIKALTGYQRGLTDKTLIDEARRREVLLLSKVRKTKDARKRDRLMEAWPKLEAAYSSHAKFYAAHMALEGWMAPSGKLASVAKHILRWSKERDRKNELRMATYRESNLESLKLSLYSKAPVERGLETRKVAIGLENIRQALGAEHPMVKKLLAGKTPAERAQEAVSKSRLDDVALRKTLFEGGRKALAKIDDPMLQLVRIYEPMARELHDRHEDQVESIIRAYSGRIAEAYREAFGRTIYPDATFTLRLNDGKVKAYREGKKVIPWRTTFAQMFARYDQAKGAAPYQLPKRWLERREAVASGVSMNFVTTNDIIGGNSGSPMLGASGEVVGLVFDGNIHQLPNRFLYREAQARSIGVHSEAIIWALTKVYDAPHLVKELRP